MSRNVARERREVELRIVKHEERTVGVWKNGKEKI